MRLKVGDRVKISTSSRYYANDSNLNPKCEGTLINANIHDSFIYRVEWDNGQRNSYKLTDLVLAGEEEMSMKVLKVESLDYTLEVVEDQLHVGCQRVTKEDALKIADFIKQAEFSEPKVKFTKEEAMRVMRATGCKMANKYSLDGNCIAYRPNCLSADDSGFVFLRGGVRAEKISTAFGADHLYFVVE